MKSTHIWHELTHASHFQRLKNDKGDFWASNYWSKYAGQIITNELSTGNCYGIEGGQNWQIIALAEGWANYRQWKMSDRYQGNEFPQSYALMFDKLKNIGCSDTNMERALVGTTISEFRNKLISFYSNSSMQNLITEKIKQYE